MYINTEYVEKYMKTVCNINNTLLKLVKRDLIILIIIFFNLHKINTETVIIAYEINIHAKINYYCSYKLKNNFNVVSRSLYY